MSDQQADAMLRKRLLELSIRSYEQGIYTNTNFMDMKQLSIAKQMEQEFGQVAFTYYGGVEGCERMIMQFGSVDSTGYEVTMPVVCIHIKPLLKKFADELSHRDFLGALMNLGIEREQIGDIIAKEKEAYCFCMESISGYIIEHLTKVKHTNIRCEYTENLPEEVAFTLNYEEAIISSSRIDVFVAKIVNGSRSKVLLLFQEKKVFVNGRVCENHSYQLKEGDVIVIRGHGKIIYDGILSQTRKEKVRIGYRRYC